MIKRNVIIQIKHTISKTANKEQNRQYIKALKTNVHRS